ncbi:ABC transporter permease [Streptomyces sp. NPDC004126]|uniref:ABC transporter permease n=1 Tax=Streptomyces sp. NPDC004126 TaxID=3390695 RepID=UPI003D03A448
MRGLRGPFRLFRPGLAAAVLLLGVILLAAVSPASLTSADPLTGVPAERLLPPGPGHWWGTDQLGRDLYARVVHGTGRSLGTAALAAGLGLTAGCVIGLVAGYAGGWTDDLLMRGVDALLAVPALLLSLALVTALGTGRAALAVAVGVPAIGPLARVMRAATLRARHSGFVEAAVAYGAGRWWTVHRHVLPHARHPLLALGALEFGFAVLAVSGLGYLGYGAEPPTPEWGLLVADGRDHLATSWWLSVLPGLAVAATVLAVHHVARTLDRDPRSAG